MKNLLGFFALVAFLMGANTAFAQVPPPMPRTITVTGEASEKVAPDQAALSLSLTSKDPSLARAKEMNDALVKRLVAITQDFKIAAEKVATSGVNISPEYSYDSPENRQILRGYVVSRTLQITIADLTLYEKILSAAVDAKIDQVNGIEFSLAEPETVASRVRVKAYENAKAKATALTAAAGAKLGQPLTIVTSGATPPPMPMPMMAAAKFADAAMESSAPTLPGMITVQESLTVTFGLE